MALRLFRIAGLSLYLQWEEGGPCEGFPAQYDRFRTSVSEGGHVALSIRVLPSPSGGNEGPDREDSAFMQAGSWAVSPRDEGWHFVHGTLPAGKWRRALVWSPASGQARLWIGPKVPPQDPLGELTLPFFTAVFAHHQGLLIHAAAVEVNGRAWVFAGPGGWGKSYWARRWQDQGAMVLDEDRLVLRRLDGQVWAFGTPWHYEPRLCSPQGAPVERIFFLRQSEPDTMQEVRPAAAAAAFLLRSSRLPVYDPDETQAVLDVAGQAAAQARAFFLGRATDGTLLDRLAIL